MIFSIGKNCVHIKEYLTKKIQTTELRIYLKHIIDT